MPRLFVPGCLSRVYLECTLRVCLHACLCGFVMHTVVFGCASVAPSHSCQVKNDNPGPVTRCTPGSRFVIMCLSLFTSTFRSPMQKLHKSGQVNRPDGLAIINNTEPAQVLSSPRSIRQLLKWLRNLRLAESHKNSTALGIKAHK